MITARYAIKTPDALQKAADYVSTFKGANDLRMFCECWTCDLREGEPIKHRVFLEIAKKAGIYATDYHRMKRLKICTIPLEKASKYAHVLLGGERDDAE